VCATNWLQVSFEERAKFKEETLTNVDGRTQKHRSSTRTSEGLVCCCGRGGGGGVGRGLLSSAVQPLWEQQYNVSVEKRQLL
jgi:hypothetical protein